MTKNCLTLIGMPASGKSSVGVVLAKKTGRRFVDGDLLIQEQNGKLLKELIAERGDDGKERCDEDDGVAIGGHKIFMSKPVGSLRPFNHVGKDLPVSFNIMKKETLFSGTTTAYGSIDSFSGNFKVSLERSNNLVEPKTWKTLDPKDYHLTGIVPMYSGASYQLSGLRVKEPGFYRITIQQEDGEKLSGTQEIKVFTYQSEYAFTGDELAKVKAVSQIWDNLVDTLKKQSPKLSGDQNWIKASDEVKSNIDAILAYEENEKVATKENRPHYYSAPTDWRSFSYLIGAWMADTIQLRK